MSGEIRETNRFAGGWALLLGAKKKHHFTVSNHMMASACGHVCRTYTRYVIRQVAPKCGTCERKVRSRMQAAKRWAR